MSGLRCSALPKLAACPAFEGKRGPVGPAALRGTALDVIWRSELAGVPLPEMPEKDRASAVAVEVTKEDRLAVKWAVERARLLSKGAPIETMAEKLKVKPPYLPTAGEMDGLICFEFGQTLDLKTGMLRNYREQMAAYSLACMEETFSREWVAHLIFCDQREVVTYRFTYEEADQIVRDVVAAYHDPEKVATPCDYCGWCAHARTCDARLTLAENALTVRHLGDAGVEALKEDPEKLSQFLTGAKVVAELNEDAKDCAKELGGVPGFKVIDMTGREFVSRERLLNYLVESKGAHVTPFDILEVCPMPTPNDLRNLIEASDADVTPEEVEQDWLLVARADGHQQLRQDRSKK